MKVIAYLPFDKQANTYQLAQAKKYPDATHYWFERDSSLVLWNINDTTKGEYHV